MVVAPRAPALPLSQYFASPPCLVLVNDLCSRLSALPIYVMASSYAYADWIGNVLNA